MNGLLDWINASHRRAVGAALLCLIVTACADIFTGYQIALHLFYAIPVLLIGWRYGPPGAAAAAAVCAVVWTATGPLAGLVHQNALNPYWNFVMRLSILAVIGYLVCAYRFALLAERRLSRTDPLTGLANRRHFLEILEVELKRSSRYRRPFALLYVDVDNFKALNDTRGHHTGDSALYAIARVLAREIRGGDTAARLGGDEFAVLLVEAGADIAVKTARRLFDRVTGALEAQGWPIGISAGLAVFSQVDAAVDDLLKAADAAMYEAKSAGKNRLSCVSFSRALDAVEVIAVSTPPRPSRFFAHPPERSSNAGDSRSRRSR